MAIAGADCLGYLRSWPTPRDGCIAISAEGYANTLMAGGHADLSSNQLDFMLAQRLFDGYDNFGQREPLAAGGP